MGRKSYASVVESNPNLSPDKMLEMLINAESNSKRFKAIYEQVIKNPSMDSNLFFYLVSQREYSYMLADNPHIDFLVVVDPEFMIQASKIRAAFTFFTLHGNLNYVGMLINNLQETIKTVGIHENFLSFLLDNDYFKKATFEDQRDIINRLLEFNRNYINDSRGIHTYPLSKCVDSTLIDLTVYSNWKRIYNKELFLLLAQHKYELLKEFIEFKYDEITQQEEEE